MIIEPWLAVVLCVIAGFVGSKLGFKKGLEQGEEKALKYFKSFSCYICREHLKYEDGEEMADNDME